MYKTIAIVVAVVIVGGLLYLATRDRGPQVEVVTAAELPIQEYIDEQGKTRLPRIYKISMPFAARVGEITLEEGDHVQAGQVVAEIVQEDVQAEYAEAQAAVQRLTASIRETADKSVETTTKQQAEYFVQSMINTVESAKTQMTASRSRFEYATTYLERVRKLIPQGAKTEDDLDRAQLQKVENETEYQTDALTYQAILSIDAATKLLPSMVSQFIDRKDLSVAVLQQEKAEAEARLRTAELRLARSKMTSPVAGIVLHKELTSEQQAAAGTLLLEIGQMDQLEVEAEILSQDATRIRPGNRGEIFGPSLGKQAGAGVPLTVDRVYPAGFTKVSSLGVEQQRVLVILRFDSNQIRQILEEHGLGVEYRVQVRIYTEEKPQALVIPRSAIFRDMNGNWQAYVELGGRLEKRTLKLGLMNDLQVEVLDGIESGEHVLVSPESSLSAGETVSPVLRSENRRVQ
ncbi:HlyD family efflux transporter periplasmic adaptor subunit [Bremerella cremea]|uniref:HlyD family efflux transporter periplasmic adaptor subunit n=1 Tax=Bremerella cremea TaxID=1031537 RepID=A0A368KUS9_9BACT|nr:HlyD family efflux transporter periplasmic adaptor subunit [Bremerella cremea]RCS52664.1 HlyD family efflux transporter periplasmic adaptor subunit [Bremerella cremea]